MKNQRADAIKMKTSQSGAPGRTLIDAPVHIQSVIQHLHARKIIKTDDVIVKECVFCIKHLVAAGLSLTDPAATVSQRKKKDQLINNQMYLKFKKCCYHKPVSCSGRLSQRTCCLSHYAFDGGKVDSVSKQRCLWLLATLSKGAGGT